MSELIVGYNDLFGILRVMKLEKEQVKVVNTFSGIEARRVYEMLTKGSVYEDDLK